MSTNIVNHPDYPYEKKHLEDTIQAIRVELPQLVNATPSYIKGDTLDQFYATKAVSHFQQKRGEGLSASVLTEPFFGRLDIKYNDSEKSKPFYIGKVGFSHNSNIEDELSIVDWKADISSLYYEGVLGTVNQGGETCEITLRRQHDIKDAVLLDFFEAKLTEQIKGKLMLASERQEIIADPILIKRLEEKTNKNIKNIIETIKRDQNEIIRQPFNQVTVTQGVAGSGKSSVALHRISYLLYTFKNELKSNQILIIAPSNLFLDYISGVIPELDLTGVQQLTFENLAWRILENEYPLAQDEKFEMMLTNQSDNAGISVLRDMFIQSSHFKCSLVFRDILANFIDKKIEYFIETRVKEVSLFNGEFKVGRDEQLKIIKGNPFNKGIDAWKQNILFLLKNFLYSKSDENHVPTRGENRRNSSWVPSKGTDGYFKRLQDHYVFGLGGKTDAEKVEFRKEYETKKHKIEKEEKQFKQTYFADIPQMNPYTAYKQLFIEYDWDTNIPASDYPTIAFTRSYMEKLFTQGQLEREDLASLCYLKYLLDGYEHLPRYHHIVADEAQDIVGAHFN